MKTPEATGPTRLPALDGVRGLAILMVVFWHYYACVPRPEWVTTIPAFEQIAGYAWTGVPLFFVLSGFLIGRILIQHRGAEDYYRVFFLRRVVRILPLYFVALVAFVALRALLPPAEHPVLQQLFETDAPLWSYAAFVQNVFMAHHGSLGGEWLSVTWSLAIEEQFYLILPFIVAVTRPAILPRVMVGLVAFAIGFRWLALGLKLGTATGVIALLPSRIDALAIGVLIATQMSRPHVAVSRGVAAGGAIGCAWAVYALRSESMVYLAGFYTLIAAAFGFLVWHVTTSSAGRVSRALAIKPLMWLGSVSYFVYLFHQPTNHLVHFTLRGARPDLGNTPALLVTVAALGIVLIVAEVSRRWFEAPIIAWGKRCTYGEVATPPAPASGRSTATQAAEKMLR